MIRRALLTVLLGLAACTGPVKLDNEQVSNRGAGKDNWWDALPRQAWSRYPRVAQSQDWFEVYRVAPGVLAIYEPGQFEEVISYLITGSERALLFDTGLGIGDMRALVDKLTPLPVTVVNSHSHYDHIGGNHAFDRVLAVDHAYTLERSGGLAHDRVAEAVGPGWIWKKTPPGFDAGQYRIEGYSASGILEDGMKIDLGVRVLEVLLTPGHAPDALCLFDAGNRLLFTGDTFYPAPLYTHLPGSDFEAYANSANRLAGYAGRVDWLMTAHNEPAVDPVYLGGLARAFEAIADGSASFVMTDGNREYPFEGFSIITP